MSINLDTDECPDVKHNCSQICAIRRGGVLICGCYDGYQLDNDGVTCNGMQYKHIYRQLLTLTRVDGVEGYCNQVLCSL